MGHKARGGYNEGSVERRREEELGDGRRSETWLVLPVSAFVLFVYAVCFGVV